MTEYPDSAARYAARVDAYNAQQGRTAPPVDDRWAAMAANFRLDPRRALEPNLVALAGYVEPGDTLIDVGGGAGRISLPLALSCREVINVEPSAGMRREFDASAQEAGITNARAVSAGWPDGAESVTGDVSIVANVTYFVREIVPFIEALNARTRRRVIISVWSVPPPNQGGRLFELIHGEPFEGVPTHRDLLPVLWDLGLLPEIRVLPDPFRFGRDRPPTREAAVQYALTRSGAQAKEGAAAVVEAHFDELFSEAGEGFLPQWAPPAREMLITWLTS